MKEEIFCKVKNKKKWIKVKSFLDIFCKTNFTGKILIKQQRSNDKQLK